MLLFGALLLAGAGAASTPPAAPASRQLYRLELVGSQTLWSQDHPLQSGSVIVFHRYPDGALLSIKRADVLRIVVSKYEAAAGRALPPGGVVDLGPTGSGSARTAPPARASGAGTKQPAPGERKDGTALFNPDRPYRPDWDSKQVPGTNIPFPASPNDYREGSTLAYPPASSVQTAPGDVPRARVETGEPPKAPQ